MHISLRGKASLASLLTFSLLLALGFASWAFSLYLDMTTEPISSNATLDTIRRIVAFALMCIFFLSFFLSAISIPRRRASQLQPVLASGDTIRNMPIASFWVGAALALALSLFGAYWYYQLSSAGGSLTYGVISAAIALIGLAFCVLLAGVAIRHTNA
jgi:hypothetical protein